MYCERGRCAEAVGRESLLGNTDSFLNLSSYAFNRGTGIPYCIYVMELAGGVRKGLLSL